jgi:hypothetical protein
VAASILSNSSGVTSTSTFNSSLSGDFVGEDFFGVVSEFLAKFKKHLSALNFLGKFRGLANFFLVLSPLILATANFTSREDRLI